MADTHYDAEKVHHLESNAKISMNPYYQRQKCWSMTLVSENIRCTWIFEGFLWAWASNDSWVVNDRTFWRVRWLLLRKLQEIIPAILHGDMLPLVSL